VGVQGVICVDLVYVVFALEKEHIKERYQELERLVGKIMKNKSKAILVNYPLGDFLIRIKNAKMAGRRTIQLRSTKIIKTVADALKKQGFLDEVILTKDGMLSVKLTYQSKEPLMTSLSLVSKPGLRVYKSADELAKLKGPEIYLVSTPVGILSANEAIKARVGGEVIVKIL